MTPRRAIEILQNDYANGAFHNGYERESEMMQAARLGFNSLREGLGLSSLSREEALARARAKHNQ